MVLLIPSINNIEGFQPILSSFVISINLRGVPSSLVKSKSKDPVYPISFAINSASSFIETSTPHPILTRPDLF